MIVKRYRRSAVRRILLFLIACLMGLVPLTWVATSSFAETYLLVHDFGVQGKFRRCKYSNGKVYALPASAPECFKSIRKSKDPAPTASETQSTDVVAPSGGIWWHPVDARSCRDDLTPAQAFERMKASGLQPEVAKEGEKVFVGDSADPENAEFFFPTRKSCEEALAKINPPPSQMPQSQQTAACTADALTYGQQLRNSVAKLKNRCELGPSCGTCVPYYNRVRTVQLWDAQHPGCGTPLAGSQLMISTVVNHLRSKGCSFQ